jgi:predicted Zn finger-like uncharacterized protein
MIISCECKKYKFVVRAEDIGKDGRLVQCGVCDKQWFQEPPTLEEFKTLKDNYIQEDEEKLSKESSKKQSSTKNVPIKYKEKTKVDFNKLIITILIILIIGIFASFQFKDLILAQYPGSINYFSIVEEFGEYISKSISSFIDMLIPKN